MLDADAVERLIDAGRAEVVHRDVYVDHTHEHRLVRIGDGLELRSFERAAPPVEVVCSTLEGLVDYCNGPFCAGVDAGLVLVRPDHVIVADANPGGWRRHQVILHLERAPEFCAFNAVVGKPHDQQGLWRLLVGDLAGCIDDALTLSVQRLRVVKTQEVDIDIDVAGVTSGGARQTATVKYKAANGEPGSVPLQLDWQWTGRLWKAFGERATVDFRVLVAEGEKGGVGIQFLPRKLDVAVAAVTGELVEDLRERLHERWQVYEGWGK